MAYPTPALDLPLHTDLGLMAQRRCRLLRQAHQPAPQTWRIPISRGARNRHRALHRRDQRRPQTLPVDRTPKPHPRGCQTWEANVRVDPLVAVAILAMVLIPPALAKAKRAQSTRAQSAPQQGYQSSERPGYYHGYPLSEWYRDSLSSY